MAVTYSKLGGCLGETTKLGPLARTDLCAGVKGLLDMLMTHLGLGSPMEEPWGLLLALLTWRVTPFSREAWEDWKALCLSKCLTTWLLQETALYCWGMSLSAWEAWEKLSLVEHLTAWVETKLLPAWEETKLLLVWRLLPSWEGPPLDRVLLLGMCWLHGKPCCPRKRSYLPAWRWTK